MTADSGRRGGESGGRTVAPVHRLCYVDEPWAWFTSRPVEDQWGDDWNDAPYEHNAGNPYQWMPYMADRGVEPYTLVRLAFSGDYETPSTWATNSRYSVQRINQGVIAWLAPSGYRSDTRHPGVFAGATVEEFIDFIRSTDGEVYTTHIDGHSGSSNEIARPTTSTQQEAQQ